MIIKYNNIDYDCSPGLSLKDFTGRRVVTSDVSSGDCIYGSCFSQETPDTNVFPIEVDGLTFIKCNLDNVEIPENSTLIDCVSRRFKCQNDLRDWEVDEYGDPVKLLDEDYWIGIGKSVDKDDIPQTPFSDISEIPDAVVP